MSTEEQPVTTEPTPSEPIGMNDVMNLTPPPPPPPITINDLLSSVEVLTQKENQDKVALEGIGNMSHDTLKNKLLSWATAGFPNVYEITRVTITPPALCSDGVNRNLADYIVFCSGKTISEHVEVLAAKVTGMNITFANMGTYIAIVVSKP
jgi:hypothetical protein